MPLILILGVLTTIFWSYTFGRKSIFINNLELSYKSLPKSFDNYRIALISDIHIGSFGGNPDILRNTRSIINDCKPELLLFTGDLVNNFANETVGWDSIFTGFYSTMGKFAVLGNHDYGNYFKWNSESKKKQNFDDIVESYSRFGFKLLRNSSVSIKKGQDSIFIIGVDNWGLPPFPQYADLKEAVTGLPEDGFKILLSHDPAHWKNEVEGKKPIQLTFSGHTHGAQWGLKLGGIEFSPIYLERHQWAGLYGRSEQYLYINRGLGTIGLNFRLDMPAEVTIITLRKKES